MIASVLAVEDQTFEAASMTAVNGPSFQAVVLLME